MRNGNVMERPVRSTLRGNATHLTLNDSLPLGVLLQLLSPKSPTDRPALSLFRVRNSGEAYQFACACFDSRRTRQIVLMTTHADRGWIVDPREVAKTVGEYADVVMLDDRNAIYATTDALTKAYSAYSGAVRVLRPGLTPDDDSGRHPLIRANDSSAEDILTEIELYIEEGTQLTTPRASAGAEFEAAIAQAVAEAVRQEREKNAEALSNANARATALKRALSKAEAALDEEQRPVFADPHAQFRFELHHAWLHATEEGDRQSWPLREWELGPEFLDSIDAQQIVDRTRVIRACVDVITGRHAEINSRASHQFGPAGAAARRREDGSMAWRCSINTGPAAARLMWWERADGIVELSLVAAHDDFRII